MHASTLLHVQLWGNGRAGLNGCIPCTGKKRMIEILTVIKLVLEIIVAILQLIKQLP
ncbi:TPA: hypothetical protein ACIBKF_003114 [Salmonella enterica subsp. enterica serovar 6,7:y:-]